MNRGVTTGVVALPRRRFRLAGKWFLSAGAILMLVAGCSLLPGGAGEGDGTDSDASSSSGQTNEDEATMLVVDAVKSSSTEIASVKVIPAVDGLAKYLHLYVTMTGEQITAAQIEAILTAVTGVNPDGNAWIEFSVWESEGLERLTLVEQAQELGVPEEYVLDDYTLDLPLEWLESKYGTAP